MTARALWRFDAIGTSWEVESDAPLPEALRAEVRGVIGRFDATWSRFRADSLVTRLAAAGGAVPAPPDAAAMLDAYVALDEATGGAVQPLVGASLAARGYDAALSLVDRGPAAAPADWRGILRWRDGALALDRPALIDIGALGKGRLVDIVHDHLRAAVAGDVVVDGSGDLAVSGTARVGLEHPFDPQRAIGVWEVTDAALCASATNRRAWGEGLHHVLDARTGEPVRTVVATWAVAPTAMRADAIATALFFPGGDRLAHAWGVAWVRMLTDGRVEWSPGCDAELFTAAH
jgi:thiamine biosynthesis lipoprotein